MAVKLESLSMSREDFEFPEDYYLYLLHFSSESIVVFQWHFREQTLKQKQEMQHET